jgi:hypothetical protein
VLVAFLVALDPLHTILHRLDGPSWIVPKLLLIVDGKISAGERLYTAGHVRGTIEASQKSILKYFSSAVQFFKFENIIY